MLNAQSDYSGVTDKKHEEVAGLVTALSEEAKDERGTTIMDFLTWAIVAAAVLGFIMLVAVPKFKAWSTKNTMTTEARAIVEGANAYYEDNYKYPKAETALNGSYVNKKIFDKGWNYSCSGSTITLTTPGISDASVRNKVNSQFAQSFDSSSVSGTKVVAKINDKPCP